MSGDYDLHFYVDPLWLGLAEILEGLKGEDIHRYRVDIKEGKQHVAVRVSADSDLDTVYARISRLAREANPEVEVDLIRQPYPF